MTTRRSELEQGIEGAITPRPDVTGMTQQKRPDLPARKGKGWRFTSNGLSVERDLSETEWLTIPTEMRIITEAMQLNVGDATLYGLEHGYIKSYDDMARLTGYTEGSIKVYASLCRSLPQLIRINGVLYGHYQLIAPLPEDDRAGWIQYVAEQGVSRAKLKKAIAEYYPALPSPTPPLASFAIATEKDMRRAAKKLAEIEQMHPEKRKEKHILLYRGIVASMEDYVSSKKKWLEQGGGDAE